MQYDSTNEKFRIAVELVNQSSRNIFLTGKAGTGKTTFLKYIRENSAKQIAVVAPTGVAAINAGGVTIHSFFQLPLMPFVPEVGMGDNETTVNPLSLISRQRMNAEKTKVLQQLELLVIDEVSMVRADTMDAIDTVLRHARRNPMERFGGVQVLFIGDMFQLSPVIRDDTWSILSRFYESPYFFDSRVIREEAPLYIEFNKIYRQSEERFIRVLNQVRNNELDEDGAAILNERYQPGFPRTKEDGYIVLTTHNETVREVNTRELESSNGLFISYKADIDKDFPENSYPGDEVLRLKIGAQVMFIKNDPDKTKRYYNGKIGIVTKLETDKVCVKCKGEDADIEVKREKWENIRYTVNKSNRQMEEEVLGSFSQFPLRLAWAITIHKSQGLTFEKAIIDVGKAFAAGQVYVALSRCTSLDGLVLQSRVNPQSLMNDPRIVRFSQSSFSADRLERELAVARRNYQESTLISSFDFKEAINKGKELQDYLQEHSGSFNVETLPAIDAIMDKLHALQDTAYKFQNWIRAQFAEPIPPEENKILTDRLTKAVSHFSNELKEIISATRNSPAVTDSKLHAKEYNETLKEIFAGLSLQQFQLQAFNGPFDIDSWHRHKKSFVLPAFSTNAYAGVAEQRVQSEHPVLHQQLRKLRAAICAKNNLPIYIVAGTKTIDEMAYYLPLSPEELEQISGFGKAKVEAYGEQFLEVIRQYCEEQQLSSRIAEKTPKKAKREPRETRTNTRSETYRLYKEGMNASAIAQLRKLTIQTIEGHLAYYIKIGEIDIAEFVSPEKLALIKPLLNDTKANTLTSVKDRLGAEVSFSDIKFTIAWQEYTSARIGEDNT